MTAVVLCPDCGLPLMEVSASAKNRILRCHRCKSVMTVAHPLEEQGTAVGRDSYRKPLPFGPKSLPARVLAHLRAHGTVDDCQARELWGHTRLAATIHTLRTHGFPIETMPRAANQVATYRLPRRQHEYTA